MDSLQRAVIEKTGRDHGFENVIPNQDNTVELGSARHQASIVIGVIGGGYSVTINKKPANLLLTELARSFPTIQRQGDLFVAKSIDELALLLRRAAALAKALPNQAAVDYESKITRELANLSNDFTKNTEIERVIRQRVGQQAFRQAMMDYWGGACAVTGVALPDILRASHAKPWAECDSDAERLDVFNGFLLTANLDALFDRYLISFNEGGKLLVSSLVELTDQRLLGIDKPLNLRWLAQEHKPYLEFHLENFRSALRSNEGYVY